MRKIKETVECILFLIAFFAIIAFAIPELREGIWGLAVIMWATFQNFFMEGTVKTIMIYGGIAALFIISGCTISKRRENAIWEVAGFIVSAIPIIIAVTKLK